MGIMQKGTRTIEFQDFTFQGNDQYQSSIACIESIPEHSFVAKTYSDTVAGLGTVTRSLKVLSADTINGSGNISKAGYTLTAVTAGSFKGLPVGTKIIHGGTVTMYITNFISDSTVMVDVDGTLTAGTWTYQLPTFKNIYPGATLTLNNGVTTVESKVDNFSVNTVGSGSISSTNLTSYANQSSIVRWAEDGSRGELYGVTFNSSYTAPATFDSTNTAIIYVKEMGAFDRTKVTTYEHQTAGTVPISVFEKYYGRFYHNPIVTSY